MDYKARFYSPALGRFIQPDNIIPGSTNPQSWNRYSYVKNNPIRYSDPTGHWEIEGCVTGCSPTPAPAPDPEPDDYCTTHPWVCNPGDDNSDDNDDGDLPDSDSDTDDNHPGIPNTGGGGVQASPTPLPENGECMAIGQDGYLCSIYTNFEINQAYQEYNNGWQEGVRVGFILGGALLGLACGAVCVGAGAVVGLIAGNRIVKDLADVQGYFDRAVPDGMLLVGRKPGPENVMFIGRGPIDQRDVTNPITQLYLKTIIKMLQIGSP
jgi:hypothetical protein